MQGLSIPVESYTGQNTGTFQTTFRGAYPWLFCTSIVSLNSWFISPAKASCSVSLPLFLHLWYIYMLIQSLYLFSFFLTTVTPLIIRINKYSYLFCFN